MFAETSDEIIVFGTQYRCSFAITFPPSPASKSGKWVLFYVGYEGSSFLRIVRLFFWRAPQQILRTHRNREGLLCNPVMKMIRFFLLFHFNGAPVEWNWQGKTDVLREKPVPVPLRDRTRASAVRARRLTAWAMARPTSDTSDLWKYWNYTVKSNSYWETTHYM
jgi:hypothetical protein